MAETRHSLWGISALDQLDRGLRQHVNEQTISQERRLKRRYRPPKRGCGCGVALGLVVAAAIAIPFLGRLT